MSIGNRSPTKVAEHYLVRMIETNGGVVPSLADATEALGHIGNVDVAAVLDAAISRYNEKVALQDDKVYAEAIRTANAALGSSYEPKSYAPISFKRKEVREPFLVRPIRAFRQWLHDLSKLTQPTERSIVCK